MSQYKISKTRLAEIIKEEYSSLEATAPQEDTSPSLKAAIAGLDNHWENFTSQVMESATAEQAFTKQDVASAIRLRLGSLELEEEVQEPAPAKHDETLNSIRNLIRQELQSL